MIRSRDSAAESLVNRVERVAHRGLAVLEGEQDHSRDHAPDPASVPRLLLGRQFEYLQHLSQVLVTNQDLAVGVQVVNIVRSASDLDVDSLVR